MQSIEEFYAGSEEYVALFNAFAVKHSLSDRVRADHICYKCDSLESYERMRKLFESESNYIYQAIISQRRIALIRLARGIETSLGTINFLELSDQKPDNSQKEGFDHIEAYPLDRSYEEIVVELKQNETVIHVERPHHTTDDIDIGGGFLFRCTEGPLVEKIKREEMI